MTKKYLNGRWCVRCNRKDCTPYLRDNIKLFPKSGLCLDIGCGNGRNSKFMKEKGYDVISLDMVSDYGKEHILGKDLFPRASYDIILANYVLMFLNEKERHFVIKEIKKNSKVGTFLMVEMYPAKDSFSYDINVIITNFLNWKVVRKSKDRFILRREK